MTILPPCLSSSHPRARVSPAETRALRPAFLFAPTWQAWSIACSYFSFFTLPKASWHPARSRGLAFVFSVG